MPDEGVIDATVRICRCEAAARWAALTYEVSGIDADVEPMKGRSDATDQSCKGWTVAVHSLRRIEFVLDPTYDLETTSEQIASVAKAGWEAWALVPLARLAGAHDAFRSCASYVQGWWERNEAFAFTQPEIP